jgi:hypothetical protein
MSETLKRLHGIVILGEPDQARDLAARALGAVRAPLTARLGM